jgi:hypothetical protein
MIEKERVADSHSFLMAFLKSPGNMNPLKRQEQAPFEPSELRKT